MNRPLATCAACPGWSLRSRERRDHPEPTVLLLVTRARLLTDLRHATPGCLSRRVTAPRKISERQARNVTMKSKPTHREAVTSVEVSDGALRLLFACLPGNL